MNEQRTQVSIFAFFLLASVFLVLAPQGNASTPSPVTIPGEVVFTIKGSHEVLVIHTLPNEVSSTVKELRSDADISYAQPNYIYNAALVPNDPHFDKEQHLQQINAPQAWNITTGSPDIIAAFIDSGIDTDHDDLKDNLWTNSKETPSNLIDDEGNGYVDDVHGWNFIGNNSEIKPDTGGTCLFEGSNHGTVVAGVAVASGNNGTGIAGVAWKGKIMMLKALDCRGQGTTTGVVKAIDYAINNGAKVINMSFVGSHTDELLNQAIARAYSQGVSIVASAGNDGVISATSGGDLDTAPSYPVCIDGPSGENYVIGVASVNERDRRSYFSNIGTKCVDISAPGENIMSTQVHEPELGGEFIYRYRNGWDGTSMSAPQVTGAVMLLRSLGPGLSNAEITSILKTTADSVDAANTEYVGRLGTGRLNIFRAILEAQLVLAKHNSISGGSEKNIQTTAPFTLGSIIVVTPRVGDVGLVRVFTPEGKEISSFYPYGKTYKGGIVSALGDIDGDGIAELLLIKQGVTNGEIRIYDSTLKLVRSFLPFASNYRGEVSMTIADLDGDQKSEIVVASRTRTSPQVKIFDPQARLVGQFLAFPKQERLSLRLGSVDFGKDGKREIVVSTLRKGNEELIIMNSRGEKVTSYTYPTQSSTPYVVQGIDLTGDGEEELALGYGQGVDPYVKIINMRGQELTKWFAFPPSFKGGIVMGSIDINNDGKPELVVGAENKGGPMVRVLNSDGSLVRQWWGYASSLRHGISLSTY